MKNIQSLVILSTNSRYLAYRLHLPASAIVSEELLKLGLQDRYNQDTKYLDLLFCKILYLALRIV